ncbi:MAG: glycosyltransferase [Campylobacterales bacterium]|nr:glycosyltransferase [Campylobacterales bacterium]
MFVSIIIPTYKDVQALGLILDALKLQTYKNFEVIVAEDDDSKEVAEFLKNYVCEYVIKHFFHENLGNRKAIIMNKALLHVSGEYIIFIDGDTIPYSNFIEAHVLLSEKDAILCGRRVNLGDNVSKDLRENKITALEIEKKYLRNYRYLHDDNIRHYEQGFSFRANSAIQQIMGKLNKNVHILASNYSCYKDAIFAVNGFDENLPFAPNRDDTDLEWRLKSAGYKMKSCKYCANLLHLNHPRTDRKEEGLANMAIIRKKQENNEYITKNGIQKL